jgi:hypothetical protein
LSAYIMCPTHVGQTVTFSNWFKFDRSWIHITHIREKNFLYPCLVHVWTGWYCFGKIQTRLASFGAGSPNSVPYKCGVLCSVSWGSISVIAKFTLAFMNVVIYLTAACSILDCMYCTAHFLWRQF